ncbi:cytochrome P450 [Xylaria sp. FL0043]|nr:cytochrome P450 [Xylaria sp. FL0043]
MDSLYTAVTRLSGQIELFFYALLSVFFVYGVLDAFATKSLVRKQVTHPFVGAPISFVPKFILNLLYAWKATNLAQRGYEKYKNKSFQIIRNEGPIVVLPLILLEELSRLPASVAEGTSALNGDLVGSFTGVDLILENRLHHSIVQRKLTPRIPLLLPQMEKAVHEGFAKFIPQGEEWTVFQPYKAFAYVSARLNAEPIVGSPYSSDPEWLHIAVEYTENLFRTVVVLRSIPVWMRPVVSRLLPSYWTGWSILRHGKKLLRPRIQELIDKNNTGTWQPENDNPEDLNVLSWLSSMAKGRDRSADIIGHVMIMVALATVHTTLLRMVNVLYDVVDAGSELQQELLDEIQTVTRRGWNYSGNPYDALEKLDSVLRESQRLSPPTTLGMKRLFRQAYTFQDGTHVSEGTYVAMPVFAIENDPSITAAPEKFDGLRAYRARRHAGADSQSELLFSSPGPNFLNFGYGKTACPGRFFASVVVKMVIVKALTEYDFKFLPGSGRPKNILAHEFLFTWPWTNMLVRRKAKGTCPF